MLTTRQHVGINNLFRDTHLLNEYRMVAPACWTNGQLPAEQEIAVPAEASLLAEQYAAAEYCSKRLSWSKRS